jgi:3-hydroxyacyl-CoA dehydrogenase
MSSSSALVFSRKIKHVTVLGSGVMGSRIACHFANIGVNVLLLDIAPDTLNEAEKSKGIELHHPLVKNRIVNESLQQAIKANPAPLYHTSFAERIQTGNFDDNLKDISQSDWVIEVVVENLDIKNRLFDRVEQYRKPGTLVTSNTSGIPIHMMAKGRSEDFRKHFCGTHFFNPPRYLRLLEIIPTPETDAAVVDFLMKYGDLYLGKTTVLCKDTPAFIANRIGVYGIMSTLKIMEELDLSVEDVDKLTGVIIGRPKSATFRTSDVVGLDTLAKVADFLGKVLPDPQEKATFALPQYLLKMLENKWLGDKTGQGFYKKIGSGEQKEILSLNLKTLEYGPQKKSNFATLELTKTVDDLIPRIKILIKGQDKAGEFYRKMFGGLFHYAASCIPSVSDTCSAIDNALCAGFGWDIGPFALWDGIGLEEGIKLIQYAGHTPPAWVLDMKAKQHTHFFRYQHGSSEEYSAQSGDYAPIKGVDNFIILNQIRHQQKIWGNAGSTLLDIGDGVCLLEFHTKMNTLGSEVIEGIHYALSKAEKEFAGLVIGNDGANFSAGANLALVFMYATEQEYDEIDFMVRQFQNTILQIRYASIPVVVAPHQLTLGGACEMALHADHVQAHAETYIGLVELGVGVIPAGCGTKEMAKRVAESYIPGDIELNNLQNAFMNIAMAKVATSAHEAKEMRYLRPQDGITVNRSRLLFDAKNAALQLATQGYMPPQKNPKIKVQGKNALALFKASIHGMLKGGYISEHDAKVANKLAYVISGGDLSYPQLVSEQYLLDLEREAFMSLCGERKTLERIQSVLTKGKPIRN